MAGSSPVGSTDTKDPRNFAGLLYLLCLETGLEPWGGGRGTAVPRGGSSEPKASVETARFQGGAEWRRQVLGRSPESCRVHKTIISRCESIGI